LAWLMFTGSQPCNGPPKAEAYSLEVRSTQSELSWLLSTQRDDGAIALDDTHQRVVPYFSNLAALALLDEHAPEVLRYLEWYLARLNRPDRFGLHGTVYDRYYVGGVEKSTYDYDSADSYAATFLSLVRQYQVRTADLEWVSHNLDELRIVAGVISSLQDADGLVWAKPNHKMKYLMDNCENYRGLMDWADLLDVLGETDEAAVWRGHADSIKQAIDRELWDSRRQKYLWGVGRVLKRVPRNGVWYPDNVAQLYPVIFGVISAESERAVRLYSGFNEMFPTWPELIKKEPYPWAIVAYAARRMGDAPRAHAFIESSVRSLEAGRSPVWHAMESAFLLMTMRECEDATW